MTVTATVLTVLSIVSSFAVLSGSLISTLRRQRRQRRRSVQRSACSNGWHHLHFCLCLLDAVLLVAGAPLFVVHALKARTAESIWDTAFETFATTFAITVALVFRSAAFAVLTANMHWKRKSSKRLQVVLPLAAAAVLSGIVAVTAVRCTSIIRGSSSCAAAPFNKFLVVSTQIVFAACATVGLVLFSTATCEANKSKRGPSVHPRTSIVARRAPSLSLLIHTQPDPWTRHIDLNSPVKTEFGPRRPSQQDSVDYGPQLVHGILGDTDRTIDATTASLGYASAVASSTNPYHICSGVSLASRDAVASLTAASRIDLAATGAGQTSRYATTTSKSSAPLQETHGAGLSSRTPSPGMLHVASRPHSRLSAAATEGLLLDRRANSSSRLDGEVIRSRTSWGQLATFMSSLWCPIALSSIAMLVNAPSGQAYILLASFCFPATLLLARKLVLGCSKAQHLYPRAPLPIAQIHCPDTTTSSARTSIASSAVIVYSTPEQLRYRRPHLRSRSCPLESELNGYGDNFLSWNEPAAGISAKQRQSLSSAKSVPYLGKHWAAGKVIGDRVVAPRRSFVRGLNFMLNPKPRLEVLPCPATQHEYDVRSDKATHNSARQSVLPTADTSAVAEVLLEAAHVIGRWTADSERTCITQCYALEDRVHASSSMVSLHIPEIDGESVDALSEPRDVILNLDDSPGSPRLLTDMAPLAHHTELQSPTKRRATAAPYTPANTSNQTGIHPASSPSFSCSDDSHVMGSSASRLFTEIMDILRSNSSHSRMVDLRGGAPFSHSLHRSPPKGYASIDAETAAAKENSRYDSASETCETIVIHSMESSCDFRTAASQSHPLASGDRIRADEGDGDQSGSRSTSATEQAQGGTELVRNGSTSSTLSFSSISTRFRSLRRIARAANVTPSGSPNARARGEQHQVKKIRSRTFASAFGIELGILNRNGFKSRSDTSGSHVDSSPSTSAGTCPSSLMDLSLSPSPAVARQTTRLFGDQQETSSPNINVGSSARKAHRRNLSRADSIMDLLDEQHSDTIEELLEIIDAVSCASQVDEPIGQGAGAWNDAGNAEERSFSEHFGLDFDGEAVGFDEACEVDLADVTVHDAWERCFEQEEYICDNAPFATKKEYEGAYSPGEDDLDLMGFNTRRLVARAPFLDTVVEAPEDELVAEGCEEHQLLSTQDRFDQGQDSHQGRMNDLLGVKSNDFQDLSSSSKLELSSGSVEIIEHGAGASRGSLLLKREVEQRRVTQLLMEYEVMFPQKTLSSIEEVTEAATTLRSTGFRTSSAASGSKFLGDNMASTADANSIHLGLPLSLACQRGVERSENGTSDSKPTVPAGRVDVDVDISEDRDQEHEMDECSDLSSRLEVVRDVELQPDEEQRSVHSVLGSQSRALTCCGHQANKHR
ncbi:hypothetical protein EX895_002771 [Sporisorium graminicola]|uniref:Uncharacterized protein n=1 Tax=Sporisorium graminicola TaxID=280036 RepID=A0A4V6ETY6_9BASI|nr:hypothetical protein EX895_002771 [Sporisorium graminicola]TKY88419.1 hypothetical protein EX895_002771 [Sporisorium graminicola]